MRKLAFNFIVQSICTFTNCHFRSHPVILEQPNKMFYHGELQVWADKYERESLCRWDALPKKGFPILFHGVVGKITQK